MLRYKWLCGPRRYCAATLLLQQGPPGPGQLVADRPHLPDRALAVEQVVAAGGQPGRLLEGDVAERAIDEDRRPPVHDHADGRQGRLVARLGGADHGLEGIPRRLL